MKKPPTQRLLHIITAFTVLLLSLVSVSLYGFVAKAEPVSNIENISENLTLKEFIKWVDFNVTNEVLTQSYDYDLKSYGTDNMLNMTELLAYAASKNGNRFKHKRSSEIDSLVKAIHEGKTLEELTSNLKYYNYYKEAFDAVLGGFTGEYTDIKNGQKSYGLTVYSPIAKGYWYSSYNDFGANRGYGFKRTHLGNDLMGSVGTPIIAVEGGSVYEIGWNRFGGWRIGIMSKDKKRYYYYAHLRKDKPYYKEFAKGDTIAAGDIIGYLGNTGYSFKENVNMKSCKPHLHYGLQLIFDESQIDSPNEIWIDNYEILKFLQKSRMKVAKNEHGELVSLNEKLPAIN